MNQARALGISCLLVALYFSLVSCTGERKTWMKSWCTASTMTGSDGKQQRYETRLVDIRMEDCEVILQRVGKVEVRTASGTRIIPGLITVQEPQLIPPKTLFCLHYERCEIKRFVHYDLESGKTTEAIIPDDLDPYLGPPSLSPSAKKIAYIAFDREGGAGYRVRSYPRLQLVKASPMRPVHGGDVPWGEPEWLSEQTVRFDSENLAEEADKREWNRVELGP